MADITLTAKVKLIVDDDNKAVIDRTLDAYRRACNYASDHVFETHDLSQYSLNKALYHDLRDKFALGAQMAQSVLKTVIARYKTILENQHEWTKASFRKPQADLVRGRDYSLLKDGRFSIGSIDGRLKLPFESKGMEKYFDASVYTFGTAKIVVKHGKYFLHIPVTFSAPDSGYGDIVNVVGIDRGINFIAASYGSDHKTHFISGRQAKQTRSKYKEVRRQLQSRQTPSSRRRLKAIGGRENRWMNDVNHQVSKTLVRSNPEHTLFVLEDLTGIRSATEKVRRKDRYETVSWAFYDLEQKLMYKAACSGSSVIKVDPAYTSQTCPACGHTEKANRNKKIHLFCCRNCGYRSNDDRIGAMNLYRMGINFLAEEGVPDTVISQHA